MLKSLIGSTIGTKLAKDHPALGGAAGTMVATAIPFVLSRISVPAMIAIGVGGYVVKRVMDNTDAKNETAVRNK